MISWKMSDALLTLVIPPPPPFRVVRDVLHPFRVVRVVLPHFTVVGGDLKVFLKITILTM